LLLYVAISKPVLDRSSLYVQLEVNINKIA